jgi:hypothetical protein
MEDRWTLLIKDIANALMSMYPSNLVGQCMYSYTLPEMLDIPTQRQTNARTSHVCVCVCVCVCVPPLPKREYI